MLKKICDEQSFFQADLVQLVRLVLSGQEGDVRLFIARLVRKYRKLNLAVADQLDTHLRAKPARAGTLTRKLSRPSAPEQALPVDDESRLSLLKKFMDEPETVKPLLNQELEDLLDQLLLERREVERLAASGLRPARSAIFLGRPGVGKTITARWIAAQLGVPLYILDLTAVMSSLLGKSGINLRSALDFAKQAPCVLLLDEIDAVAKRRNDDSDVGELKRLVTVMLQEVEEWPDTSLLLAATNFPELVDPALWRRFDLVVDFKMPSEREVGEAVKRFLGPDLPLFNRWVDILAFGFTGDSYSDIERSIYRFRRALALGTASDSDLVEEFTKSRALTLERPRRIELAILLSRQTRLSQHAISEITGVSRDTIRKYSKEKSLKAKGLSNE